MSTSTLTKTANHPAVLRRALQYVKALRRRQAEYDADVDAWYRSGDGRSPNWRVEIIDDGEVYRYNAGGKGYRYPACIHGTSHWTDYDNICGPCEDGLSRYDGVEMYKLALSMAHADHHESKRRWKIVEPVLTEPSIPIKQNMALAAWATEPMTKEV